MTRKERFLTALRLGVPDVVPVAPLIHARYAHRMLGRWDWRAVFEVHQRLGSTHFRGPIGTWMKSAMPDGWRMTGLELIEERNGRKIYEQKLITPKGTLTARRVVGMISHDPLVGKWTEYLVKEPRDWEIFKSYYETYLEHVTEPEVSHIAEACRVMGEDGVPSVGIGSVFQRMASARGMQQILYDLYDCPDLLEEVRGVLMKVQEHAVRAFLASPAEVAWQDICWATGANMGPGMFERWVLPEIQLTAEKVRKVPHKFIGLYTLGRIRELLPMMVEARPHFIETFEPNEGDISLREAKQLYGDRICIMGNFDCVTLARGTVDDARREAMRCLEEAKEGGGYIMVTGDEVPADARWENLKAMVETVEEHGRY